MSKIKLKAPVFILMIISILAFAMGCAGRTTYPGIPERPDPPRLVNDCAGVFSEEQCIAMENRLVALDDSTGNQIVVVTVTDLAGYDIADFSTKLGNSWGVGQKEKNNGVVIVVKILNDTKGQAFVATGLGIEKIMPDATCQKIVDAEMIPHFRANDYYGGIEAALDVIIPIVNGERLHTDYDVQKIVNE